MANQSDVKISRARPAPAYTEGTLNPNPRNSRYGEASVVGLGFKTATQHADEGSYFVATNPTPGTGIVMGAAVTSYVETTPFFLVTYATTSGRRLYFDFLKLVCTVAGVAGTSLNATVAIDNAAARYTSGGTAITPVNPNMDDSNTAEGKVYAGALVAAAAANKRLLWSDILRVVIPVIGDTYLIEFGGPTALSSIASAGTAVAQVAKQAPPVILGDGDNASIVLWLPSQSTGSAYELTFGFTER